MGLKLNCEVLAFQLGRLSEDYDKRVDLVILFLVSKVGFVLTLDGLDNELWRH